MNAWPAVPNQRLDDITTCDALLELLADWLDRISYKLPIMSGYEGMLAIEVSLDNSS